MAFTPKDWKDAPDATTPLTAAAMEDLETRVTNYTNDTQAVLNVKGPPFYAVGDDTTDDTAALQAGIDASMSTGLPLYLPSGSYRITAELVAQQTTSTNGFAMSGYSADKTIIRRSNAGSIFKVARFGSSQSERQGGLVEHITFQGSSARPHDGSHAVQIDGVRLFRVRDCRANNIDIGFDIINNGFGSTFEGLTVNSEQVNVGLLLRGAYPSAPFNAHSGSDINVTDCWLRGHRAAVWTEGNAGGYHFWGGQLGTGGFSSPVVRDDLGGLVMGPTYFSQTTVGVSPAIGATSLDVASGTNLFTGGMLLIKPSITSETYSVVTYTGKSGNTLTGIPASGFGSIDRAFAVGEEIRAVGGAANVILYAVSFEGVGKKHLIRGYGPMQGIAFNNCGFHAPPGNAVQAVMKLSGPSPGQVMFDGAMPSGGFSATVPLIIDGPVTGDFHIEERATRGGSDAGFKDPLNPTGPAVLQNFATRPMLSYSGLETNTWATFHQRLYLGGLGLRWTGGRLERSTDATLASWYPLTGREATLSWDPPSIAAGESTSTNVTLTGAAVGDLIHASSSVVLAAGVILTGTATATDTVRVTLTNTTAAPVDVATTTIKVKRLV